MIISGVITFGSLQFASRAADSWKIASSVLTFLFWASFHQSLRNSSELQGTTARRLHTAVLDTPRAVLKCQLPQGCRKPDLSTTFLERQTQTEKTPFGWLRWSNLSWAVVCSQETIYWAPDRLPYGRNSSLFISFYHMLDNSQVPCLVAFHRPYLPLLPCVLHQNLASSFSAEDYFFSLLPVQWNTSVSGGCTDFLTQSEGKQVSCQLAFLLATHPWNTAEPSIC